jgi:hypothetical protein
VASFLALGLVALVTPQPLSGDAGQRAPLPESVCLKDAGDRRHDGFFARSEPGIAFLTAHVDDRGASPRRSGVRGVGQSAAVSLGGTPLPGLVVGGTLWTARIDPVFTEDGVRVSSNDDSVKLTMLRLGPFLDWYPDERAGFHALANLTFDIHVESDEKGDAREPAAFGGSFGLGAGHEWFLASSFSLGAVARLAMGASGRAAPGGLERTLYAVPELLLTATYH